MAVILGVVLTVGIGFWLYIQHIRTTKPPEVIIPPPKPQPPETGWTRIMRDTIVIPGTDSYCEVAAWIPTGADRYRPGETLVVVVGMRNPYQEPVTVRAPDTGALVDVKVVLEGKSYGMQRGDPTIWFGNDIDSMSAYYSDTPQPRIPGYALAWSPSPAQLSNLPRHTIIQPVNEKSPSWMGAEWTEVARVEIPCDEVAWGWGIESRSTVYLLVNRVSYRLRRNFMEASY